MSLHVPLFNACKIKCLMTLLMFESVFLKTIIHNIYQKQLVHYSINIGFKETKRFQNTLNNTTNTNWTTKTYRILNQTWRSRQESSCQNLPEMYCHLPTPPHRSLWRLHKTSIRPHVDLTLSTLRMPERYCWLYMLHTKNMINSYQKRHEIARYTNKYSR